MIWPFKKKTDTEKWVLVKTISFNAWHAGYFSTDKVVIFCHLYETENNKRKTEYTSTIKRLKYRKLDEMTKEHEYYHEVIYKWLAGRYDPDIPRYEDIPLNDIVGVLKG